MSMYNDMKWRKEGDREHYIANSFNVPDYARKFAQAHWSFLGPGSEKKWHGTHVYKPYGEWDEIAEILMLSFSESGHPVFQGSSASERADWKSKGK